MTAAFDKNLDSALLPPDLRGKLIPVHCMNPECRSRFSDTFYVDSLHAPCPSCGAKEFLYPCDAVHLLVPSITGMIVSKTSGRRYNFACTLARKAWTHGLKHPGFPIHHTVYPESTTCSECLQRAGIRLGSNQQFFPGVDPSILAGLPNLGS